MDIYIKKKIKKKLKKKLFKASTYYMLNVKKMLNVLLNNQLNKYIAIIKATNRKLCVEFSCN